MPRPGSTGIAVDVGPDAALGVTAPALEALGFDTLWLAGGQLDALERVDDVVRATSRSAVGTAVVPLGVHDVPAVVALRARLADRLVLGVGGPQQPRPLAALGRYLDALDAAGIGPGDRLLAALGPRKLDIARERAAGAMTLLTTPAATAAARARLGPDRLLVVHQLAALQPDAAAARAAVREPLAFLAGVPGYRASFRRMGFTDDEVTALADRLVDAVAVWGDAAAIAAHLGEHRAAGADHVVVSLLPTGAGSPLERAGAVARALGLSR